MSFVNIIIIEDKNIYFAEKHYREVIKALNNRTIKDLADKETYLDAGYLVIDLNSNTILNAQNAFNIEETNAKQEFIIIHS